MGTKVSCELKDCVYWKELNLSKSDLNNPCDCQHPDKAMYMGNGRCPLYKKDWASKDVSSLAERFRKKGRA